MRSRVALLVVVLGLYAVGLAVGAPAAPEVDPAWSVGQGQVSPELLVVTPSVPAPEELTLRAAVDLALARNLGFRSTIENLLVARSNLSVARQRWSLTLDGAATRARDADNGYSATGTFSYAALSGADFSVVGEMLRSDGEETEDTYTASFSQPLLAGRGSASSAYETVRSARNAYRLALLSYFSDRQDLIVSVISSYFSVVQQQQVVDIQNRSVAQAEKSVSDAQARLDEGMNTEIDVLRAKQTLSRERSSAVTAVQTAEEAMDSLMATLGLKIGSSPKLVTMVDYQPQTPDVEASIKVALEHRPDLARVVLSLENSEAAVRLVRSRRLPTLDLTAGLTGDSLYGPHGQWSYGLSASVPIGSRSLVEGFRQSQWALLVARQGQDEARESAVADVRSQARSAEAARRSVDIETQGVEVAERSRLFAQEMVDNDLATNKDVLDAQDELRRSQIALVESKIGYYLATVRLQRSMGLDVSLDLPDTRATEATPPAAPSVTPSPAAAPAAAPVTPEVGK